MWGLCDKRAGRLQIATIEMPANMAIAMTLYCSDSHIDSLPDWMGAHHVATATMPATEMRVARARKI